MKINSTIGLTLLLLASMIAAGIVSAVGGMSVGREALKGITQPDTRPTNKLSNRKGDEKNPHQTQFLQEDKILAAVKARTDGKAPAAPAKVTPASPKADAAQFPMTAESQGIMLEVKSVQSQGENWVMAVSLKNESGDPVKFLYTFLEVKDEQGQVLSASTEGLPAELPPDATPYAGTVRIPMVTLNKAKTVSIALADYPDQQVQLKLANIPIAR